MGNRRKIYGELYYQHAPSLLTIIKNAILDKTSASKKAAESPKLTTPVPPSGIDMFTFAVVVEGKVEDIIQVSSNLANAFSREHQLVEFHPQAIQVHRGDNFTGGQFRKQ